MIHRRDEHLPFRWLADRADGHLPSAQACETDDHLAECLACGGRFDALRRTLSVIGLGALDEPPAASDRRAVALFASHGPRRAQRGADVAKLVFDGAEHMALATRGPDAQRRLLWTLPGYEIDASVVAAGGRADFLAQVVPDDDGERGPAAGSVTAWRGSRRVARSAVGADGRFTFRGLAPGGYTFEGDLDGRPFVLPLVVVG